MAIGNRESVITTCNLVLELDEDHMSSLFWFLQSGFVLADVEVGCSLKAFLTGQLGMTPEFIRECISTIFLDGKPVDDLDTATVHDGSRLALSSAMPGLVGATMRRGGVLASLRSSITYKDEGARKGGKGSVNVKLFNMVMTDAGPRLLQEGILVSCSDFESFMQDNAALFEACRSISLNGMSISAGELKSLVPPGGFISLSVKRKA